jgi:hypothetical protein
VQLTRSCAQVVKAEDCRLLGNMARMKAHYRSLRDVNRDLLQGHDCRVAKHAELAGHLKTINRVIHAGARLRLGTHKEAFVAACHRAIKEQESVSLQRALREGA